ncbi:cytoskeleton protein RodZ [Deinobacterium chartae]|uniref:Cytoskeleton protein RodZ n=1 Tax=Deinobacterium chartae TaxID=521158 RepID=A0A841I394_9DEIO|nr:helix-turn-helix domain-containing protein [Deinobacterium chartae]MBB6099763.1 cytoskeleton protein RodZ [Deinobacterium chartae]
MRDRQEKDTRSTQSGLEAPRAPHLGERLRAAREAAGLSVAALAERTKIRSDYLAALEALDLKALPERLYCRAYVQRYAREVGLDEGATLAEFDRVMPQNTEISQALRGQIPTRSRAFPTALISGIISGVVVLGAAGWYVYSGLQARPIQAAPAPTEDPPVPQQARQVRLTVKSTPPGAQVYVDNALVGRTPVLQFPVTSRESAVLRLEADGYRPLSQTVNLDDHRSLQVSLEARVAPLPRVNVRLMTSQAAPATGGSAPAGTGTPGDTPGATPPAVEEPAGAATPDRDRPADEAGGAAEESAEGQVKMSFVGRSWVRITSSSGEVLYEGIPAVGTVQTYDQPVRIRAGSAGSVQVAVGDADPEPMGQTGSVVERAYP